MKISKDTHAIKSEEEYYAAGSLKDVLTKYFHKGVVRDKNSLDEHLIGFVLNSILDQVSLSKSKSQIPIVQSQKVMLKLNG